MKIARRSFMGIAACLLCSATGSAVVKAAEKDSNWSYEGDNGPRNWHRLSDDHAACAGDERTVRGVGSMHHVALKATAEKYQEIVRGLKGQEVEHSIHGTENKGSVYMRDPDNILVEVTTGYD